MAILGKELDKEKKILKLTTGLLNKTLNDLKEEVKIDEQDLTEFKKIVWSDSHSFDEGDIQQARLMTSTEENKTLQKEAYYKKLCQIKNKPLK